MNYDKFKKDFDEIEDLTEEKLKSFLGITTNITEKFIENIKKNVSKEIKEHNEDKYEEFVYIILFTIKKKMMMINYLIILRIY